MTTARRPVCRNLLMLKNRSSLFDKCLYPLLLLMSCRQRAQATGTTLFTIPIRAASGSSTSSPVSSSSLALVIPTSHGSHWMAPLPGNHANLNFRLVERRLVGGDGRLFQLFQTLGNAWELLKKTCMSATVTNPLISPISNSAVQYPEDVATTYLHTLYLSRYNNYHVDLSRKISNSPINGDKSCSKCSSMSRTS